MISNSGPEWKNYKPKSDVSITPKQPKNKTTSKAIEIIRSISKILPLSPKVHKDFISSSTDIFYDVHKKGLIKGRDTEKVATTVVYIVCRMNNLAITLDEIATASGIPKKEIIRLQKFYSKSLHFKLPQHDLLVFLKRFSSDLRLDRRTFERCEDILQIASTNNFSDGLSPNTVIGAVIYLASKIEKDKRSQSTISKVVGVSELTIRNGYQRLNEFVSQ